jgi:hypothetical protein
MPHATVRHNLQPGSNGAPVAPGAAAAAAAAAADEAAESDDELEGGSSATWSPERRTAEELVCSIAWQHGVGCTAPHTNVCCMRHPGQPLYALRAAAYFRAVKQLRPQGPQRARRRPLLHNRTLTHWLFWSCHARRYSESEACRCA